MNNRRYNPTGQELNRRRGTGRRSELATRVRELKTPRVVTGHASPRAVLARARRSLSESGTDSNIEVSNFRTIWPLVRPHLPAVEDELERGVNAWLRARAWECVECGLDPTHWQSMKYAPAEGPWSYGSDDHWFQRANEKVDEAIASGRFKWEPPAEDEDKETAQIKWDMHSHYSEQFYPQPDTPEWYQLQSACHWLVAWQVALGKRIFPTLRWKAIHGDLHSFAAGIDEGDNMKIIFDILNFETMTAKELIDFASQRDRTRSHRHRTKHVTQETPTDK